MSYFFLWLALALALADWWAVGKGWKALEYATKPAVMLALLLWLWNLGGFSSPLAWFTAALAFSLVGDICLMLPREQFIAGLVAFLLAHLAYVVGFNATPLGFSLAAMLLAVLVATTGLRLYRLIAAGLQASGQSHLRLPVLVYSLGLSLMLLSALLTLVRPEWAALPAWLVSAGATLFFVSDSTLAWNRFLRPLAGARLIVIVTYHLGQALIVLGVVLHYRG